MYSVYSNASITFAAAAAHDCHDGLFSRRAPGSLVPLLILGFRGGPYHVQAYSVPDERQDFEMVDEGTYVNPSYPLLTRAWCFQERLVSPRVLFFGVDELILECPTERSCEEDRYSPPSWREGCDLGWERWETLMHRYSISTGTDQRMASHWFRVVQPYNDLELSEPTDRLSAIAAIAQRFARYSPDDEYMCGLWKSCILECLLLRHHAKQDITGPHIDHGPSIMVESSYIAPSWSWASVRGIVYGFAWLALSPSAVLTSVNLRYIDNNEFGRVAPGSSITLRAPVLDCVWDVEYEPDETLSFWQDIPIPCPEGSTMSWRFAKEYDTYAELRRRETVKVCVLLMGLYEDGGWEGLILRRISDSGHYFRVGILCEFERSDAPFSGLKEVLEGAPVRDCVVE